MASEPISYLPAVENDLRRRCSPSDQDSLTGKTWDIVVIGAGPAGTTAASVAADAGADVLLLDRYAFPRDKVCGDGLIADTIRVLDFLGVEQEVRDVARQSSTAQVFSPDRTAFNVGGDFHVVTRYIFDAILYARAKTAGAVCALGKVRSVECSEPGNVVIRCSDMNVPVRARVAIIATGANVSLAKTLGMVERAEASAVAIRGYIQSSAKFDELKVSYDKSIAPGYGWIFPLRDGIYNVGAGIFYNKRFRGTRPNLKKMLRTFMVGFPAGREISSRGKMIGTPYAYSLRCSLSGVKASAPGKSILAIGETIGTTFPFTGEGIGKAMEVGKAGAEHAVAAINRDDYVMLDRFSETLEKSFRDKYLGYEVAERWLGHHSLNNFLAKRTLKSRFLQQGLEGIINETVDPRSVFSFRGVLRSFIS